MLGGSVEKEVLMQSPVNIIYNENDSTPISINDDLIKAEWVNLDEGWCGDYNEDDPDDVNLLRFDISVKNPHTNEWEEVEDASYCTRMPADSNIEILEASLLSIFKEYRNAITDYDSMPSVKKLGEQLSWIGPNDVKIAS